jgi:hypothetical protein
MRVDLGLKTDLYDNMVLGVTIEITSLPVIYCPKQYKVTLYCPHD